MKLQGNTVKSECNQEVIPPQGNTITTDRIFPGTVIFADASCKYSKIPGSAGLQATGIGVFIRNETAGSRCSVMIQAATSLASSVFQAEAKALLLAAEIAHHLNVDMPTFLTDNKALARVTASKQLNHPLIRWDSRDTLARLFFLSSRSLAPVFHIKRDQNGVAHNCAHQALRRSLQQPIFTCISSAHETGRCPVLSLLNSASFQGFVIHAVLCA